MEPASHSAFQGEEVEVDLGLFSALWRPNPMPDGGAFGIAQAVSIGTDVAGLNFAQSVLDSESPLVVAIDVTSSFRNPDANGYVTYNANENVTLVTPCMLPAG